MGAHACSPLVFSQQSLSVLASTFPFYSRGTHWFLVLWGNGRTKALFLAARLLLASAVGGCICLYVPVPAPGHTGRPGAPPDLSLNVSVIYRHDLCMTLRESVWGCSSGRYGSIRSTVSPLRNLLCRECRRLQLGIGLGADSSW